jgi:hypothetical protein
LVGWLAGGWVVVDRWFIPMTNQPANHHPTNQPINRPTDQPTNRPPTNNKQPPPNPASQPAVVHLPTNRTLPSNLECYFTMTNRAMVESVTGKGAAGVYAQVRRGREPHTTGMPLVSQTLLFALVCLLVVPDTFTKSRSLPHGSCTVQLITKERSHTLTATKGSLCLFGSTEFVNQFQAQWQKDGYCDYTQPPQAATLSGTHVSSTTTIVP